MCVTDSNDGFYPGAWGPAEWLSLFYKAMNFPLHPAQEPERVKGYIQHFWSLTSTLPCAACRQHLRDNYAAVGFPGKWFASRQKLTELVHVIHNRVNAAQGKPPLRPLCDITRELERNRACPGNPKTSTRITLFHSASHT